MCVHITSVSQLATRMIYEGHDPGEAAGGHHSPRVSSKEISFCGCPQPPGAPAPLAHPPCAAHAATQRDFH